MSRKGNFMVLESTLVVARGWVEGEMGSNCLMGTGSPLWVMQRFWNETGAVVAQHCECSKCHEIIHFKMVNYMLCEFHLNFKSF